MISDRIRAHTVMLVILLCVVCRSWVFIFYEQAHFDSDQAVFGLMTKHLVEGRAFPMYMYGQRYMLAVSVYLAAPFVWLFGPSVPSLKIVLLFVSAATAWLLFRQLRRGTRLSPMLAGVAMLCFVMPSVPVASRLVEFQGGNAESFFWIVILWMVRSRPVLFGIVAAVGVQNREFVAYGLASILVLDGDARRKALITVPVFAAATLAILGLAQAVSTNYFGPRTAFAWRFDTARLAWLFTDNLPDLLGLRRVAFAEFNIGSRLGGGSLVAAGGLLAALAIAAIRLVRPSAWRAPAPDRFAVYLCLVGLMSIAAYVCAAPVVQDRMLIRYNLLALLLPCGLLALYFAREARPALRAVVVAGLCLWAGGNLWSHLQLQAEYLTRPVPNAYRVLVGFLAGRQLSVGRAPYWAAYQIAFLSGERVVAMADSYDRIPAYRVRYEKAPRRFELHDGGCGASGATILRWCVIESGPQEGQGPASR